MLENQVGQPTLKASRRANDEHQIEATGEKLRGMMPWISAGKMVDKAKELSISPIRTVWGAPWRPFFCLEI